MIGIKLKELDEYIKKIDEVKPIRFLETYMKQIYLDHASAMPVDPRVLAFAERYLREDFGNPYWCSSRNNKSSFINYFELAKFTYANTLLF